MLLNTFDDLRALLMSAPNGQTTVSLRQAWLDKSLLAWIETRAYHFGQPEPTLLQRIQTLAPRLARDAELGLFALKLTLDPSQPLPLTADLSIRSPTDLETVFSDHPHRRQELLNSLRGLLVNGHLIEWIRARGFPSGEDLILRLQSLPKTHGGGGMDILPAYAVRWGFNSKAPFPAGDQEFNRPEALAAWIDSSDSGREQGLHLLESGWLDLWLHYSGRLPDPRGLQGLRTPDVPRRARIEMLLRLLNPARPSPQIAVAPTNLNLGKIVVGAVVERTLTITTSGRGYTWGAIALEGQPSGAKIAPLSFDATPVGLNLTIDTRNLIPFTSHKGALVINSFDGVQNKVLRVPITYHVGVSLAEKIGRSLLAGLTLGGILTVLRVLADSALGGAKTNGRTLDWVSMELVTRSFDRSFWDFLGIVLLGSALLGVLIGAGVVLAKACRP